MSNYLVVREFRTIRMSPLALFRRYMVTLALAAVLEAVEVERAPGWTEPAPIIMLTGSKPQRRPRLRPYRAHYRRGGRQF
jgi:hypothetical protein